MENKVDYTLRKKYPLTDEQNEVLDFMLKKTKCVNACQTGFGKTYTCTSGLCHVLIKYPDTHAIILCPQKAVKAFKRELSEKLRVQFNELTSSKQEIIPGCRITLITHTSLKNHVDYIKNLKEEGHRLILLVDESHALQAPKSKFYQLVAGIRHYFSIVWLATATPLKNNIEGLYWMFNILDPKIFRSYWEFEKNFIITKTRLVRQMVGKPGNKHPVQRQIKEIVGYKNLNVLQQILSQYIIIKQKHYN